VQSNEFENAVEQERREPELPDLVVRALSDFERIVAAEARLLEKNLVAAAQTLLDRLYLQTILIVIGAVGMVALIVSLGLVLHQWLPWWQVLGLLGLCMTVTAEVLRRSLIPSPASLS
jgi:uncharacterized membrane protein